MFGENKQKNMITVALTLMILIPILYLILFFKNNKYKDTKLDFSDTFWKILGFYRVETIDKINDYNISNDIDENTHENNDISNNKDNIDDITDKNNSDKLNTVTKTEKITEYEIKNDNIIESDSEIDNISENVVNDPIATPLITLKKNKKKPKNINSNIQSNKGKRKNNMVIEKTNIESKYNKKEVFNIDRNDFTYNDAALVCHAYDAQLATHDQMIQAHKNGAHWCNYGWSANQMALYPVQRKIWEKLQQGELNEKTKCQEPNKNGLVGGVFEKKDLKFGVNCYGYRPKPDADKIIYNGNKEESIYNDLSSENKIKLAKLKSKKESGKLSVRPYNSKYWSKYSDKQSEYIINNPEDTIPITEKTIEDILDSQQD